MIYETFLQAVLSSVRSHAEPGLRITLQKVLKNNGITLDGLCIQKEGEEVTPAIYLNSYYEEAENGVSLDDIALSILALYRQRHTFSSGFGSWIQDFSQVSERVVFRLIHTASNEDLLSTVPHIPFLDLSLIFYLVIEQEKNGLMTVLIHNEHMALWDADVEELHRLAMENTPRLLPAKLEPLKASLADMPEELLRSRLDDAAFRSLSDDSIPSVLYLLSNQAGVNGAATILYPGILKQFARLLGEDLLILPSSIHEVLLSPVSQAPDLEEMNQMVQEVNELDVSVEERLSGHVYYYRASCDTIVTPVIASGSGER